MLQIRRKVCASVSARTYVILEQMISSGRVENVGEAVDLAIEALQRDDRRKGNGHAAPYAEEPNAAAVAANRATSRVMRDSNPDVLFD
ncbi:MAG TPA: hypothetical protein VNK23_12380 [Candidatus Dormibacteraeota bacterium]|nr:hypothetical protein [Candidatus Dormibacteraeota bacterium]